MYCISDFKIRELVKLMGSYYLWVCIKNKNEFIFFGVMYVGLNTQTSRYQFIIHNSDRKLVKRKKEMLFKLVLVLVYHLMSV